MRTPLATTKWYTEMLLSPNFGELNPKQKEYVQTMNEVTNDMIELVNTLLNISRLEIGKLPSTWSRQMCRNFQTAFEGAHFPDQQEEHECFKRI